MRRGASTLAEAGLVSRWARLWRLSMAAAMLLALATQLRVFGSAVGAALLLLALGPATIHALWSGPARMGEGVLNLLFFWGLLAAGLSLGAMASIVAGVPIDISLAMHDVFAYALLAVFTVTLAALPRRAEALRAIQWRVAILGAVMAVLQLANANGVFALPGVDPWYWDRMRGWAENPNQFALLSLVTGFCALALIDKAETPARGLLALLCAATTLAVGLQSKSNAYTLMVLGGSAVYLLIKAARGLIAAERAGYPAAAAVLTAVSAFAFAVTIVSATVDWRADFRSLSGAFARKGDDESADGALRLELWRQAIAVGGFSAGFGLGPGPHLAIPSSLVAARKSEEEPKNLSHPKVGLAPNFEAHNTVLELLVQGGALAVAGFLWVLAYGGARALRAGEDGAVALLVATIAFGSFHVIFRHPLVWFCLCLSFLAFDEPAARAQPLAARARRLRPVSVGMAERGA
jgi:hypothetical protein